MKKGKKNKNWYIFLIGCILFIVQRRIFERDTINHPGYLYFILTTVIDLILFLLYQVYKKEKMLRWVDIASKLKESYVYIFSLFVLITPILLSTFGMVNWAYTKGSDIKTDSFKIIHISEGTGKSKASIQYVVDGKVNVFSGAPEIYDILKQKRNTDIDAFFIVRYKEGLFKTYIINDWSFAVNKKESL